MANSYAQPSTKQIEDAYNLAKERYAALGVDTDNALSILSTIPISLHCWQGDDVGGFEDPERVGRGPLALGDVLVVADIMASLRSRPDLLELRLGECSSADRLGIGPANLEQVLNDCNAEINALKDALGY